MNSKKRRKFLKQALFGGTGLLFLPKLQSLFANTEAKIEILLEEPIGNISPDLYGHFTEHIGGVVYDGIWVGENSKIPNISGIRKSLVEHMKRLKPSVVRWPGGCFADSYNWRDGIGPREQRPRRANFWLDNDFLQKAPDGPAKYDTNHFGTHEFINFCKLIGAEPYLAANVRSLTPQDFLEWVDYCNSPAGSTTLANTRAANNSPEPFNVRFWGVGNESWGCGGDYTPEEYATQYRRFTSWIPRFGKKLDLIAAGPSSGDIEWTRRFFSKLTERGEHYLNRIYGWALHHYCGTSGEGKSTDFTNEDWYELISKADDMDSLVNNHWKAMGEVDNKHKVKLIVDEWGAWHRPGTEVHSTHLFGQTSTMRDAVIAALTLDTFNRHAEKVVMGNVAQLINNLHSLFLAHEEKFIVTPNYHVFEMYSDHYNGQSLRTLFTSPAIDIMRGGKQSKLWSLAGSASLHEKQLILSVVNPSVTQSRETEIVVHSARINSGKTRILTSSDIKAHNSFDNPDRVRVEEENLKIQNGKLIHTFPPASITCMTLDLS